MKAIDFKCTHQIALKRVWPLLAGTACAAGAISVALGSDISDVTSMPVYRSEQLLEQEHGCSQQTWPYVDANCTDSSVVQLRRIRVIPIGASTPSYVLAAAPTSVPVRIEQGGRSEPSESRRESDAALLRTPPKSQASPEGSDQADDTAVVRAVTGGKVRTYKVPKSTTVVVAPTVRTAIR